MDVAGEGAADLYRRFLLCLLEVEDESSVSCVVVEDGDCGGTGGVPRELYKVELRVP